MTPRQIELIENSWDYVLLNTADAGEVFYSRLFEIDANLRSLFSSDIKAQSKKLISLITFAVHKLNSLEQVVSDVRALGARHRLYNVKPEYYSSVGNALLWTLEKGLGSQWGDETRQAWEALYSMLSKIMIEASIEEPYIVKS